MTVFASKLRIQCKEKKPTFLDFTTKKTIQWQFKNISAMQNNSDSKNSCDIWFEIGFITVDQFVLFFLRFLRGIVVFEKELSMTADWVIERNRNDSNYHLYFFLFYFNFCPVRFVFFSIFINLIADYFFTYLFFYVS